MKKKFIIELPQEMHDKIAALAKERCVPKSTIVRFYISEILEREKK